MQRQNGRQYRRSLDKISQGAAFHIVNTNRLYLPRLFNRLGYKIGAEIGVERAFFSALLCYHNPGLKLYCVDAYTWYEGYDDYQGYFYPEARERMQPFDAEFICKMSLEAAEEIDDNSLDFVYIDANHRSPWIDDDIRVWAEKVRSGGIVSGHDYTGFHPAVVRAVDAYVEAHKCYPLFVIGDLNVPNTDKPDETPSWFWVKR